MDETVTHQGDKSLVFLWIYHVQTQQTQQDEKDVKDLTSKMVEKRRAVNLPAACERLISTAGLLFFFFFGQRNLTCISLRIEISSLCINCFNVVNVFVLYVLYIFIVLIFVILYNVLISSTPLPLSRQSAFALCSGCICK